MLLCAQCTCFCPSSHGTRLPYPTRIRFNLHGHRKFQPGLLIMWKKDHVHSDPSMSIRTPALTHPLHSISTALRRPLVPKRDHKIYSEVSLRIHFQIQRCFLWAYYIAYRPIWIPSIHALQACCLILDWPLWIDSEGYPSPPGDSHSGRSIVLTHVSQDSDLFDNAGLGGFTICRFSTSFSISALLSCLAASVGLMNLPVLEILKKPLLW